MSALSPTAHAANGMPLWEVPLRSTRAVSLAVAFPAGSRHETDEESGIAHLLEHLAFQGCARWKDRTGLRKAAQLLGGHLNAYTSKDAVVFHLTGRDRVLMDMADLLCEFPASAKLTARALQAERGVVLAEIGRSQNSPEQRAGRAADALAYGDHPMGRPILGPAANIQAFTRKQVLAFRERQWVPAQGVMVATGNLDALDRPALLDFMGRFPARPDAPAPREPLPFTPGVSVLREDAAQSKVWLIWQAHLDMRDVRNRAASLIASRVLADRLTEELRGRRSLCYTTGGNFTSRPDALRLFAHAGTSAENAPLAAELITEQVTRLARRGITTSELAYARAYTATQHALGAEGADAPSIASHLLLMGSERFDRFALLDALDTVTLREVRAACRSIDLHAGPALAAVGDHDAAQFGH